MKGGGSKLIMGAILVMSVSLVLVLGLVLVLLAELYCSLLLRRRLLRHTTSAAASEEASTANLTQQYDQSASTTAAASLSSFYTQGVLRAPRSILFPAVSDKTEDVEKRQHSIPVLQFDSKTQKPKSLAGLASVSTSLPPSPIFPPLAASPRRVDKDHHDQEGSIGFSSNGSERSNFGEHLMYISNPIYDNEVGLRPSSWVDNTPFETPDSSPSRLEAAGDPTSDDDDDDSGGESENEKLSLKSSSPAAALAAALVTPPLTPMKKLPADGCSVSLKDARSLGTSGSDREDSNSNNCGVSSSSLGTPCTSPSW